MKLSHCFFPLLISCFFFSAQIQAQIAIESNLQSEVYGLSDANLPSITMPFVDNLASLEEDEQDTCEGCKGQRFAIPFPVKIKLKDVAQMDELSDGSRVYRYLIVCRDAQNINLLYSEFSIPRGGLFHIYASDKSHKIGAYSVHNNKNGGGFATEMVHSDQIILEYYEPVNVQDKGNIVISQIAHGYRGLDPRETRRGLGASGNCQVDVNCPEGNRWQDVKKGVGRITLNGSDHCSGSLIQAIGGECSPYFLTADHCLSNYDAVTNSNASGFVFYFNYEYPGCNTGSGTVPTQTVSGATVVANDSPSDFGLLLLDEDPHTNYDVYYCGFDARSQAPAAKGSGIHHPSGDAKKIATHSQVPTYDDWFGSSPATSHLEVTWDATSNGYSVTEGGSSGSPLFDSTEQRILGQLHGGSSNNCSNPAMDPGIYGHIAYSWENNGAADNRRKLKPWLDPNNTGLLTEDGGYRTTCPYFVQFEMSTTNVSEGTTCIPTIYLVEVSLGQAPTAPITVNVGVTGGTVTIGMDYSISNTSLTFPTGSTASQFVSVSVENDGFIEADEFLTLSLNSMSTTDPLAMLSGGDHVININDDDRVPDVNTFSDYTIGAGAGSTVDMDNFSPFRGFWEDNRVQNIYLASELSGSGMTAGNITALSYRVFEKNSTQPFDNFTIKLKNTSTSTFASTSFETGTTQVYSGTVTTSMGWNTITFDSPFLWDGTSNIIVESCFDNDSYTSDDGVYYDIITTSDMTINEYQDDAVGCALGADNQFSERVQVRLTSVGTSPIQTDVNSSSPRDIELGPLQKVYFYDFGSDSIMLSISNLSSFDYGCTNVEINRAGNNLTAWFSSIDVTNKSFNISTEFTQTTDNVEIELYYSADEIATVLGQINGIAQSDILFSGAGSTSNSASYPTSYLSHGSEGYIFKSTVNKLNGYFGLTPCPNLEDCLSPCPDTIQVTSSPLVDSTFRASNLIYSEGPVKINNNRQVHFKAGQEVILKEEFEVIQGAEFEATIENCPD